MIKTINVSVYKNSGYGDSSNNSISNRYQNLMIVCKDGHQNTDETSENLCEVVHRHINGRDIYQIEPVNKPCRGWLVHGGNYAASTDSRFSRLIGNQYYAIPIYDRIEVA